MIDLKKSGTSKIAAHLRSRISSFIVAVRFDEKKKFLREKKDK